MFKKIIIIFTILFLGITVANASSFDSFLNSVDSTINRIDRAQSTYDTIKNKYIPKETSKNYPEDYSTTTNTSSEKNSTTQENEYIPEYTTKQTEVPETYYEQKQNNEYTAQVKTLKDLPQGTFIMDPSSVWKYRKGSNYSGEVVATLPVIWQKLEDNHYTQGSTLLLSAVKVAEYPFCHYQKGLRAWDESDVRRFLRTTFYTHLSEGFKNSIVNTSIPFADLSGNPKTIVDNFFFLSIVEWGLSDRTKNGKVIKYDDLPNVYGAKEVRYIDSWNAFDISSSYRSYTRTINRPIARSAGYTDDIFEITGNGVLSTTSYSQSCEAIRPAVNLKSTTKVKGPYKLKYWVNNSKYLIYYALEF